MLRILGKAIAAIAVLIAVLILNYTLPDREIVRIVSVNTQGMVLGRNAFFYARPPVGTQVPANGIRDVLFINGIDARGRPRVFRNEDTGWGWPPYFKVNSLSLQARASDLISTEANPRWIAVTHYGWQFEFFTIFPNAVRLREVASPDVTLIPWLNMVILGLLGMVVFSVIRILAQFRARVIDPFADGVQDAVDRAQDRALTAHRDARSLGARLGAWWARLFGGARSGRR